MASDTFRTIAKPSDKILFKDRKSKFYGYAFPVEKESEIKPLITGIANNHSNANHICYAWKLGHREQQYRTYDDGEPVNSAGMPIYGQLQSFELTNILLVVARVFGGTKLGRGGLIKAYRASAQMALDKATIIEPALHVKLVVSFGYPRMNQVMRIVKKYDIAIINQEVQQKCTLEITVRKSNWEKVRGQLKKIDVKVEVQ